MNTTHVRILDTTLRDGEQSPGAAMSVDEKIRLAHMLDTAVNVDVIEAGFPVNGEDDFSAVAEIARGTTRATICALARAVHKDIEAAGKALSSGNRPGRIHTFIATSPMHMKHKLGLTEAQVLQRIHESITHARMYTDDVQWSAEDATRSDIMFLEDAVACALEAGATTINIPDTVGYAEPDEYFALFQRLVRIPHGKHVHFSAHCHNDLGMAVANSLAAIKAGARQVECTISGIGERAGNTAIEPLVMAIRTRHTVYKVCTEVRTQGFQQTADALAEIIRQKTPWNAPVIGKNAFAHMSGIHQDGTIKHEALYEIMRPEDVGKSGRDLPIGKHSGGAAVKAKASAMGWQLTTTDLDHIMPEIKRLGVLHKIVPDDVFEALLSPVFAKMLHRISLAHMVLSTHHDHHMATVTLVVDGVTHTATGHGKGPLDALITCVKEIVPHSATLSDFDSQSTGKGSESHARSTIALTDGTITVSGRGEDIDTNASALKAYIHALNVLIARQTLTQNAA